MLRTGVIFPSKNPASVQRILHEVARNKSSIFSDEYQYLQKSTVPTMHFQKSLPRLPIPKLKDTCNRYLQALKPLLHENDFIVTRSITEKFEVDQGRLLNLELVDRDKRNKHTSYISEPWFDMYLSDRKSLPINYNPCMIYINDENEAYNSQLIRSTNLIISSLRFYKSLKDNLLEPEVFHLNPKKSDTDLFRRITRFLPPSLSWYGAYMFNAYPLDMSQYSNLFNSTRIPQVGKDKLYQRAGSKHIVALRNGNFYSFDVLDEKDNIIEPERILSAVNAVLTNKDLPAKYPVGILTTQSRDEWARNRNHLENMGNAETFDIIDSCLFIVSLDDDSVVEPIEIIRLFLHADGCNRWFDKSFTLIVSKNGIAGLNFEHAWGDGVAVLRYFQDIFKDSTTKPQVHPQSTVAMLDSSVTPRKLEFKLDETIIQQIEKAKKNYKDVCQSLSISYFENDDIGKKFCKQQRISPDAIMQLSFQLAYHKLTGRQVSTYESCSTAAFKHGRTEAVRPCTMQTKEFCVAATSPNKPNLSELRKMIEECSKIHGQLTKEAAMGQGFDRHLFALKRISEENKQELPGLYRDKGYALVNQNILSTSTLFSDVVLGGGFGPVAKNSYGIAYMIKDGKCGAVVTNYSEHTDGPAFKKNVVESLNYIYSALSS